MNFHGEVKGIIIPSPSVSCFCSTDGCQDRINFKQSIYSIPVMSKIYDIVSTWSYFDLSWSFLQVTQIASHCQGLSKLLLIWNFVLSSNSYNLEKILTSRKCFKGLQDFVVSKVKLFWLAMLLPFSKINRILSSRTLKIRLTFSAIK